VGRTGGFLVLETPHRLPDSELAHYLTALRGGKKPCCCSAVLIATNRMLGRPTAAGTGNAQGTVPFGITPAGVIMGLYIDANDVDHGFLFLPRP
jgi:hypothetical protein